MSDVGHRGGGEDCGVLLQPPPPKAAQITAPWCPPGHRLGEGHRLGQGSPGSESWDPHPNLPGLAPSLPSAHQAL